MKLSRLILRDNNFVLRCSFAVINHLLDNSTFRVTCYTSEWVDINFHRFTSSFSNRCGYSASTRIRTRCVFKSFHSGDRFQKFAVTVCVFAGCVWTLSVTATKCLRIQTNPDTCGRGLNFKIYSSCARHFQTK